MSETSTKPEDLTISGRDLQASRPAVHLSLSRAGVTGVEQTIRIRANGHELLYHAVLDCFVDLDPAQKGVHMSRFPELFAEAIEQVVIGEALVIEELAEHIAREILDRQNALRSQVRIEAKFPVQRTTPVTGLRTQEIYALLGQSVACAASGQARRVVGVRIQGINACPCAQGMVRDHAAEQLADMGYEAEERERILGAIPLATHNQRGQATLMVGSGGYVDARELLEVAEAGMSAPIFALLKRPDELHVVERAHAHPRFVEDSVRWMVAGLIDRFPDLPDDAFVLARQVNYETIHSHDVIAERSGLLGDLRRETAEAGTGARHLALEAWLSG